MTGVWMNEFLDALAVTVAFVMGAWNGWIWKGMSERRARRGSDPAPTPPCPCPCHASIQPGLIPCPTCDG